MIGECTLPVAFAQETQYGPVVIAYLHTSALVGIVHKEEIHNDHRRLAT